jgi:dTDP-4-dehydrorhamnose reductase
LELWGGHECTVNRVRSRYLDQTVLSGHQDRFEDLRLFADLGLSSIRYPVLWERVSPGAPEVRDFTWSDGRLAEIARLGMRPIVGLCHHGSGPRHTSLLDDQGFAAGLAAHARATAERYPWVEDWTPVNEPLTTARFSALYGIWYPHATNEGAFWRALLNEIDATRLSMREIRQVNPGARLVQTEDLGFCHATEPMLGQAAYENERRWITWDLLAGRVTPEHPLWERLCAWGLGDRLRAIADDPCPPDLIGLNHYLSSERLLDHRTELYPRELLGGDGPGPYVNIEAVRTVKGGPLGVGALLQQTWERYGLPIAITECHNGCTREEQMRWFWEVWRAAEEARASGVDLRAVTAWGLLGSFDWNRLLTEEAGHYETGVFDLRDGRPEPTGMSAMLKELASGRSPSHPALPGRGWWRREDRFFDQVIDLPAPCARAATSAAPPLPARPVLIAGPDSARMAALVAACELRDLAYERIEAGGSDPAPIGERIDVAAQRTTAWAVVNLCCGSAGDEVSRAAIDAGLAVATWSTHGDLLPQGPEELVIVGGALIARHEMVEFSHQVIEALSAGRAFRAASNRLAPSGYLPDAAHALLDLLIDGARGRVRLATRQALSWAELASFIAREAGLDAFLIEPVSVGAVGGRPQGRSEATAGTQRLLAPITAAAQQAVASWKLITAGRNSCPVEDAAHEGLRHAAE